MTKNSFIVYFVGLFFILVWIIYPALIVEYLNFERFWTYIWSIVNCLIVFLTLVLKNKTIIKYLENENDYNN